MKGGNQLVCHKMFTTEDASCSSATGKFRNCNDWQITRNLLQQLYSM